MIAVFVALLAAVGLFLIVQSLSATLGGSSEGDMLEARLAQFNESGRSFATLTEVELTLPFFERAVLPTLERFTKGIATRLPDARRQALQEKINLAGRPYGLTVGGFLALRLMLCVLGVAGLYVLGLLVGVPGLLTVLLPVGGGALGFALPELLISNAVRKRQREIIRSLPSALDLLTISVEAGLGFDAALTRVTEKYKNALAIEFHQVLNEIRLGRARVEAMDDMGRRCRVEELQNFIQAIIQSEQLGVGIANVLRIQSEEIRRRRRQRAEEQGQKAPLKMLFPMVGCIFPTLFIVLLGPAILQIIGQT